MPRKKKTAATAVKKAPTKSQIYSYIADETGLTRKDVDSVFVALNTLIKKNLSKRSGPGHFTIPGLMKIKAVRKAATKARKGINPFTGEETTFKAKPAHNVVKVLSLKKLKDMV